ncbi:unnamed protein product [Larinioides sclopetarius]|uniref:Uncharacterized protein n=1 Tax=Larinioides sclopetarius TaxID=280406 RepID=A0AAV2A184_9ARAC
MTSTLKNWILPFKPMKALKTSRTD